MKTMRAMVLVSMMMGLGACGHFMKKGCCGQSEGCKMEEQKATHCSKCKTEAECKEKCKGNCTDNCKI